MLPNDLQMDKEKKIIRNQYIALATVFVFFFATFILSVLLFGDDIVKVIRLVLPVAFIPILFIGISSIKNEVSIYRRKGKKQYSTGKQAVTMGVLVIVSFVLNMILLFSPIFDFLLKSFRN